MIAQTIDKEAFPELFESALYKRILSMIGTGKEQGTHVIDICRATDLDNREARRAIETIRRAGVIVCTDCFHGYFYPETMDELGDYIQQEFHRACSILEILQCASEKYMKEHKRGGGENE